MKKILVSILIFSISISTNSFGQPSPSQMEMILKAELDSLAAGGNTINRYQFNSLNERYFLNFLKTYQNNPKPIVQIRVLDLESFIALGSKDSSIRQEVVLVLLNMLDKSPQISQYASNILAEFKEQDYSKEAKRLIEVGYTSYQNENNFLLICGIAQVKSLIPSLEKASLSFDRHQTKAYFDQGWFSRLALARMNTSRTIDTLITAVELFPDKSIRVGKLLKQLAYTQHPDALRLLMNYLRSTDIISDGGLSIPAKAYAMEFLSIYVEGFPVKPKFLSYSKDEIDLGLAYIQKIVGN